MAAFSTAFHLCLFVGAFANPQLVRREEEDLAVGLNSAGELLKSKVSPHSHEKASLLGTKPMAKFELSNVDFVLGLPDTNNCSIPSKHSTITNEDECVKAAEDILATVDWNTFLVPEKYKDLRPYGCFTAACHAEGANIGEHHDTSGVTASTPGKCMYYNGIGDLPQRPIGTPICARTKYEFGANDTNGAAEGGCPEGYSPVLDEDRCCGHIGVCSHAQGTDDIEFQHEIPLNNSKHDEFPQGCFRSKVDDKIYYNPDLPGFGLPAAPVGTPICNVSTFTKCVTACETMASNLVVEGSHEVIASAASAGR